jgi:hypothetical protein
VYCHRVTTQLQLINIIIIIIINDNNVQTSPQIQLLIGNQPCRALIDTGCQYSIISEKLYNKFKARGLHSLELPTQNVVLKSAFTGRTKRVRRQALVKLHINNLSVIVGLWVCVCVLLFYHY